MSPGAVLEALAAYPGLVPGLLVTLGFSVGIARRLGDSLGTRPALGFALLMAVGLAISATVTPSGDALGRGLTGSGECDLSRWNLATLPQVAQAGEVAVNILLFIPLGIAIGLLPRSRGQLIAMAAAAALPVATEVTQLVAVPLGRECQSGDVIDNLTGFVLGLCVAGIATWIGGNRGSETRSSENVRRGFGGLVVAGLILFLLAQPPAPPPPTQVPLPTAAPTPTMSGSSLRVESVPALLDALADDSVGEIVVADGTYHISSAASREADSLWIGSRYAGRTRPVTVRAETTGGVVFDGGGMDTFGGITFVEGAHHQTWDGFSWRNGTATNTGVIVFGGYEGLTAPHHITLRNIKVRQMTGAPDGHGVYISRASSPGAHDIVIDGYTVEDPNFALKSAVHFYHNEPGNPNAWNVTIRNMQVTGTDQAVMIWDQTLHDVVVEYSTITAARKGGVRYEYGSAITLRQITSTGSGQYGFYSSVGTSPPQVSILNCNFD
jgi:hypothetical protein